MDTLSEIGSAVRFGLIGTITFLCIAIMIEMAIPRERYSLQARLNGIRFWLLRAVLAGVIIIPLNRMWDIYGLSPFLIIRFDTLFSWAGPFAFLIGALSAMLLVDFFGYWFHRVQHGPLWRFHVVHHSATELHAANGFGHIADEVFQFVMMGIPLSLLPVRRLEDPAILALLFAVLPFYIHSPVKLHFGPLRRIFTDNRFHRIHHSLDPEHFDKNFGTFSTLWDQLFRTAYFPRANEWPDTGVAGVSHPRTVWEWLCLPWRYKPTRSEPLSVASTSPFDHREPQKATPQVLTQWQEDVQERSAAL